MIYVIERCESAWEEFVQAAFDTEAKARLWVKDKLEEEGEYHNFYRISAYEGDKATVVYESK